MKLDLKHVFGWGVTIVVVAIALGGCGEFRRQATEAQARLDDAVERAQVAEDAAARNAARIVELSHRIDALETTVNDLKGTQSEQAEDDTQANDE
jgi:two-component sensor histidine kinase